MLKKWFHILLSVWLINSVTFPQIINVSEPDHFCADTVSNNTNSWAEFLLQNITENAANSSDKAHHIRFHRKFVHAKTNAQTAIAIVAFFLKNFGFAAQTVKKCISTYVIGMAILPAYYSFLFRLSPF